MARIPSSREEIVAVAKIQLNYPASTQDSQVLNALVSELEKHIRLYPQDLNFFVTPHVNNGYGTVNCLERGCQDTQIPLVARLDALHGGRDVGLGSLSAYRRHIVLDAAHVQSRDDRLAGGEGATPNSFSTASPHTSRPFGAQSSRLASGSQSVKSEPLEPSIPQKRLWGTSSIWDPSSRETFKNEVGEEPALGTPNAKRVKLEAPKTPLTPLNREASFNALLPPVPAPAAHNNADDTRERLGEVQGQIRAVEAKLWKAQVKTKKTKADYTRILKFRNELSNLQALKDKFNASLPAMKPISRTGSGVRFSSVKASIPSGSHSAHLPPAFQHPAYNTGIVASGSSVSHSINVDMLPQPHVQAGRVASGSNVKLEAASADLQPYDEDLDYHNLNADEPVYLAYTPDDERFDADGDFFGRGKDHFAGPIAKADDIDKFLVAAGNTEQFDGNASVENALVKLGLQSIYQLPPGMEVALMPHQVIGVAWMLEKERGESKGGCLADEMGLGKTVQMIATIVFNRSSDALRRTTLILCPVALLDQWQQEIELKTNLGFKCLIYHGNTKVKRPQEFRIYDVVLTSYQTLSFEWPDDEAEERKKRRRKKNNNACIEEDEDNKANVKTRGRKTAGPLFEFDWYRIVLDESQNIRNKRTRVSRAVTKLEATYRWCLTGTPIINGLADAYAPIRFLRLRPFYDWTEFNRHITLREKKNPDLATRRLQAIFATMLLRRKKDSMLDGRRLIELPNKQVHLEQLQFSQEERDVYTMVESRSQEIFNRFLRAGTVLKNYHQVLVLLLRLRQVCAHPCLITESGAAFISPGEVEDTNGIYAELARAQRSMGLDFVVNMKEKFKGLALERMQAENASPDATPEGQEYDCPICFDGYTDAVITSCGHTFCRECIMNVLNGAPRVDAHAQNQYTPEERPCPVCRGAIAKEKLFLRSAFEPTDAELGVHIKDEDEPVPKQPQTPKGRVFRKRSVRSYAGSDDEGDDGDDDLSDFIVEDDEDEEEAEARIREKKRVNKGKGRAIVISDDEEDADIICGARPDYVNLPPEKIKLMNKFLPSTKMKHMMESLRKWAEEHPDEKTLIISQWTSCLQLVSDYLTENGFLHVKYQGDMSRAKRDQAVRVFMAKDKAMVMLMSMKCGGVGLNLTRANRVISLDLGWSEAVESQAFDRIHRLGQLRNVSVHRLVIAGTVEDRILALQQRKKLLADCSLGEGTGKKIGKLSVKELANLFGLDHRGNALQPVQA